MKKRSSFMIDLSAGRVFCRDCRKKCRELGLAGYKVFWCSTKSCENDDEVRLYPGNNWKVYTVLETLQENSISEITTRLVQSIQAGKGAR
jgi:hypothetical protein